MSFLSTSDSARTAFDFAKMKKRSLQLMICAVCLNNTGKI